MLFENHNVEYNRKPSSSTFTTIKKENRTNYFDCIIMFQVFKLCLVYIAFWVISFFTYYPAHCIPSYIQRILQFIKQYSVLCF